MPLFRLFWMPLALALALGAGSVLAAKPAIVADDLTRQLLLAPDIEQMRISPDGTLLAIARHVDEGSFVSVHRSNTMALVSRITPGKGGVITTLDWFDNDRLLIGAVLSDPHYGVPVADPNL